MAEPNKDSEKITPESSDANTGAPENKPTAAAKADLPHVESPSISPADEVSEPQPEKAAGADEPIAPPLAAERALIPFTASDTAADGPSPHPWRPSLLAASIALAACVGALAGIGSQWLMPKQPRVDVAAQQAQRDQQSQIHAMHATVARLTREIAALKSGVEASNKNATSQIGKIADRVDRFEKTGDITGSIGKPATLPARTETATAAPPMPTPKPQALQQAAAPPPILRGWSVREARDGTILVSGYSGTYEVAPGMPVPGLGRIETVRRDNGRWVVVTPKGLIVSAPERAARVRPFYPPPFYRPY
jgi:hypothetical protein